MPTRISYDAVVVGSGPNGLAAAIRLAQEKLSVLVLEGSPTLGGSSRSGEITLPGFVHDLCSAVHPLAVGSPFFCQLRLEHYGLKWVFPDLQLAHPLPEGDSVALTRSVSETASSLGKDKDAYERLFSPLVTRWDVLSNEVFQPLFHVPRHPLPLAKFGLHALQPAGSLAVRWFASPQARALFAGLAGHSVLPLERPASAAFGLVLGALGHAVGWPFPKGGAQMLVNALAAHLRSLGGELCTGCQVSTLEQLPLARAVLLDVTPRQFLGLAEGKLPSSCRRRLQTYRYGPGVFKLDYALGEPIPWQSSQCRRAGTVHVGGTLEEIAVAERQVASNELPLRPFILLAQPTVFDPSRAPAGKHVAWAYCHVPNGSTADMTERVENQIERFAPGFRDCILARRARTCMDSERLNPNLVGGDINGGAADLWQLLRRPILSPAPYRTPLPGVYLCSASTPPGGGVHGMCGFHAAETVLKDLR